MPNDNEGSSNESEPKYLTSDEVGQIVNAAVTSHLRRFTEKQLPELLNGALKPLAEKIAAVPPPSDGGEEDSTKKKSKQSPEYLAMQQEMEAMKKALQAEKDRVAAAEKKSREERSYSELRSSLEGKVRPEFLDLVAKHLFVVEGRVETDETGSSLFKTTHIPYTGADPEEIRLPLKAGIDQFLKSDTAKPFLPAPTSGASSAPLPKRGPSPTHSGTDFSKPATSDTEKAMRALERERMAANRLKSQ